MSARAKTGDELVAILEAYWPPDDTQQIRDRLTAVVGELGITRETMVLDAAGVEP